MKRERPHYQPSPAEIKRVSALIRDGWSAVEERKRNNFPVVHIETQQVHLRTQEREE